MIDSTTPIRARQATGIGVVAGALIFGSTVGALAQDTPVRDCRTSIGLAAANQALRDGELVRNGRFLYAQLASAGPPLTPIGPSGNRNGRFYVIKWIVGVAGDAPLSIKIMNSQARLAFRVRHFAEGNTLPRKYTGPTVELRPCPDRKFTFFNGGIMLLDHPRCVPFAVTDQFRRRVERVIVAVGRRCGS